MVMAMTMFMIATRGLGQTGRRKKGLKAKTVGSSC